MSTRWAEVFQENRTASGSCATPSEIREVVAARLPRDRTQELLDHTLACGECALLWRLAHEAQVEAAREDAASLRPAQELGRPVPRVRWLGWAAVGAAGLAAALTFALKPRPPEREVVRGAAVGGIAPLTTDVALPRNAVVLRWTDSGTRSPLRADHHHGRPDPGGFGPRPGSARVHGPGGSAAAPPVGDDAALASRGAAAGRSGCLVSSGPGAAALSGPREARPRPP